MKKIIFFYVFLVFGLVVFNLFFSFNKSVRENTISYIFSTNKTVQKINAKVIGYSFERRKSNKSSTTFNYNYGLEYLVNNQKYFGRFQVVNGVDWEYTKYIPLPKSIPILINANNPKQFIYLETHFGKGFLFYFLTIMYLVLTIYVVYLIFTGKTDDVVNEFKKENPKESLYEKIGLKILLTAFVLLPFIKLIYSTNDFYKGSFSENISGFELIYKTATNSSKIHLINDKINNKNLYAYSDYLNEFMISGFLDNDIKKCYALEDNKIINLQFKLENYHLYVIKPKEFRQNNHNIYLISKNTKYLIPFDMIEFDFKYK